MQKELVARPTEYRGIQYRSKCEAMFALWLDLKHSEDVFIEYEPDWAELGDYVPDFVVHRPSWDHDRVVPEISQWIEIIEYKPSMPTVTYCSEVCKKLHQIANLSLFGSCSLITMNIYYGSVYDANRGALLCCNDDFSSVKVNWIGKHERRIRDYRFDLESE